MEQNAEYNQGMDRIQIEDTRQETGAGQKMHVSHEKEMKDIQTRRVGSVTFGITLVCYGILFLVHIFVPMVRYSVIFRCWPVIFILLGSEILVENYKCRRKEWKIVYDFPAVIMLGVMLFFAMIMAAIDYELAYAYKMGYEAMWFF